MVTWQQQAANRWDGFILRWKYTDQWQIVSIENGNEEEEPARCTGRYYDYSTFFHTQFHGLVTFKRMKRFGEPETGTVS